MKTKVARTIQFALAALSVLLATGCGDRPASSIQPAQTVSAKEELALKNLETKAGITFPANSVLINSGDGGGRDPSHGFFEWAVFSPTQIIMPPMKAPGVNDYLKLPLEDTVTFVQSRFGKCKVEQPQVAFTSDWQTNGFNFTGTLVRSVKGDYLVISQGRIK